MIGPAGWLDGDGESADECGEGVGWMCFVVWWLDLLGEGGGLGCRQVGRAGTGGTRPGGH